MAKPGAFKRIQPRDILITPTKLYKSWRYSTTSSIDSAYIDRLVAIRPDPSKYSGRRATIFTNQTNLDSASLFVNHVNDKEASLMWYSLDHLYYKRAGKPLETFGYADPEAIERTIFDEASIFSIPQKIFGEAIKPGSVIIDLQQSTLNSTSYRLIDDGKGNLIDTSLSSSVSGEVLYLGFNSMTYGRNWDSATTRYNSLTSSLTDNVIRPIYVDTIINELNVTEKNVLVRPKSLPTASYSWGNSAYFSGESYIRIPNDDRLNFKKTDNFAISFWLNTNANQTGYVLSKRKEGIGNVLQNGILVTGNVNSINSQYPFDIQISNGVGSTVTLRCAQHNGGKKTELTKALFTERNYHVVLQQSASMFELYVDGTRVDSSSLPSDGNIHNRSDIFIGSLGTTFTTTGGMTDGYKGYLDEFFIFNKALTSAEVAQLAFTGSENLMVTNTNAVGNVFYEHGMIVISDPRPKYGTTQYRLFNDRVVNSVTNVTGSSNLVTCSLQFNSTVTIYEHEYFCKLREDEFNFTTNPTIRLNNDPNSQLPKDFVSNEKFAPYITTIGLYSKNGELLATGKLGTPIRKRSDVDLTFIVRFDM